MAVDIEKVISSAQFFRGLSDSSRQALAGICLPRVLPKKRRLFREGERGSSIFLLVWGSIQLSKTAEDGREVVIKIIRPREVFAEVVLFEEDSYPVTAMALAESLVLQIPRAEIHRLLAHEQFRNDFIRMLMQKQRYLARQIWLLSSCSVEERFFRFLREQFGEQERIAVAISKKDLAAAIGATPETLSRLVQRLRKKGLMKWQGREIRLRAGFWGKMKFAD